MKFTNTSLTETSAPDPLWIYKVGTSLLNQAAQKNAKTSGDSIDLEAHALLREIQDCLSEPARITTQRTALELLIHALTTEALALDEVFNLYKDAQLLEQNGRSYEEHIHDRVAQSVMEVFCNSALLVHLNRTHKISDKELCWGAALEAKKLSCYGANGLHAFWHEWDGGARNLFTELTTNTKQILPKWVRGDINRVERLYPRANYFEGEVEHAKLKDDAAYEALLEKLIPRTIGPNYESAVVAKEKLIAEHVSAGRTEYDTFWTPIAALHRNYERAQVNTVKKSKTLAFEFVDESLNLSPAELERIRAGKFPETFGERLDWDLGSQRSEHEQVITDLRAAIAKQQQDQSQLGLHEPTTVEDAATEPTEAVEPKALESEKKVQPSKAEPLNESGGRDDGKKDSSHKGLVMATKAGGTLLGSILVADQMHRASKKDAPIDDPKKSEESSKVLNYVIAASAAAGVGMLLFAKSETLVKYMNKAADIFKLGKGSSL